jgi:hypothetical protein
MYSRAFRATFKIQQFIEDSMTQFVMESLRIRSRIFVVALLMFGAALYASPQQPAPRGVKFEIVSVRVLSESEAAERSPDFIGPNVAVRVRLSTASQGVSFYGWKNSPIPAGYTVASNGVGFVWLGRNHGHNEVGVSPGIQEVLSGSSGEWMTLPAYSSIEWELLESTEFAGQKHAFTAFLKQGAADKPVEFISDTFVVPSK